MENNKTKLGLNLATDPRWVNIAEKSIEAILTDHAYCEQKAASSCISMIIQYSDYPEIVETLSPIVSEEWGHFRMILAELKKRGYSLGAQRKDEYVSKLSEIIKKGGSREQRLVEQLLINGLIEARSCERFRLLSLHITDEDLQGFYHNLMVSEAGHYKTFLRLAKMYKDSDYVRNRFEEMLVQEASIMDSLELRGDRMH